MPILHIHLLDRFVVTVDGVPVPESAWRGERTRTLLQFLATRPNGRTTRDELIEALWRHLPAEQARGNLHVTVNRLRRALASVAPDASTELLLATPTGYQLAPETWVDVMALPALLDEVRGLQSQNRVAALQRTDELNWAKLPELHVDQPYSDWAVAVRERLRREYESLQVLRADLLQSSGRTEEALEALLRLLDSEPVLESAVQQAMSIAYHLGDQVLALNIFDRCRRALAEELGVTPMPETLALHARILAQQTAAASMAPSTLVAWKVDPAVRSGRVAYLCAQIQGYERLQAQPAPLVEEALGRYRSTVAETVLGHGGALVLDRCSDRVAIAEFAQPSAAVAAAADLGTKLQAQSLPAAGQALHIGELTGEQLIGTDPAVDRCISLANIAHGGQILLSAALAEVARDLLPPGVLLRDLGAHRLADLAAAEHLHQLVHPAVPSEFPPLVSLDARPGNLPVQLSRFIGRRQELERVTRLLRSSRLLTLTGLGGVGKTRLALQASAAAALHSFPDGVWFVDLAPLSTPAHVGVAVLQALGLHDQDQQPPLARLGVSLRTKRALLILDNCEHLLEACAELARGLLQSCPQLSILATSREPLGVQGEVLLALSGLPVPDADPPADLEQLLEFDAILLFLERVQAVNPALTLTDLSPVHLARICRSLDGLPLALELAAARTRSLTLEQIAERLDDRFRLLTSSRRTTEGRHQTLQAMIDWSYGLLTESERLLLRRLAVFAGGFTLPMAEEVCAGDGLEPGEILDLLSQLVDRSLLVADQSGAEVRYRPLETIRHYAADKLTESGEAVSLADRHLSYFAKMVLEGAPVSLSREQKAWFDRLKDEMENLRAALTWSLSAASIDDGLILATFLNWFWEARGHVREGREVMTALLDRPDAPGAGILYARALLAAGSLAFSQLECEEAVSLGAQALTLLKEMEDPIFTPVCLTLLGWATMRLGDLAQAERYFNEAIVASVFPAMAFSAQHGLSHILSLRGEFDQAEAALAAAMMGAQMLENPRGIAMTQAHQGALALERGQYDQANELLVEAVVELERLGDVPGVTIPLGSLARVQQRLGRSAEAARLFGMVAGLKERTGTSTVGGDLTAYQASLTATRSAMGTAFQAAYQAGVGMNRTELLAFAQSLVGG